jgi:hypothetical protein
VPVMASSSRMGIWAQAVHVVLGGLCQHAAKLQEQLLPVLTVMPWQQ